MGHLSLCKCMNNFVYALSINSFTNQYFFCRSRRYDGNWYLLLKVFLFSIFLRYLLSYEDGSKSSLYFGLSQLNTKHATISIAPRQLKAYMYGIEFSSHP